MERTRSHEMLHSPFSWRLYSAPSIAIFCYSEICWRFGESFNPSAVAFVQLQIVADGPHENGFLPSLPLYPSSAFDEVNRRFSPIINLRCRRSKAAKKQNASCIRRRRIRRRRQRQQRWHRARAANTRSEQACLTNSFPTSLIVAIEQIVICPKISTSRNKIKK